MHMYWISSTTDNLSLEDSFQLCLHTRSMQRYVYLLYTCKPTEAERSLSLSIISVFVSICSGFLLPESSQALRLHLPKLIWWSDTKSPSYYHSTINSFLVYDPALLRKTVTISSLYTATYFDSVVKSSTIFCSLETQLTIVLLSVYIYPVILFLLSKSPVMSASTYPCKPKSNFLKHKTLFVVLLKYLRIHFTSSQCCFHKLFIYLLTTPTACAISGLVHTIAYIRQPIVEE